MEQRRYQRSPIDLVIDVAIKGSTERISAHARDISIGGMYVQIAEPLPFGTEVVVHMRAPRQKGTLYLPGVVRWSRPGDGMGVQFGLLGARETYAITELTRAA